MAGTDEIHCNCFEKLLRLVTTDSKQVGLGRYMFIAMKNYNKLMCAVLDGEGDEPLAEYTDLFHWLRKAKRFIIDNDVSECQHDCQDFKLILQKSIRASFFRYILPIERKKQERLGTKYLAQQAEQDKLDEARYYIE